MELRDQLPSCIVLPNERDQTDTNLQVRYIHTCTHDIQMSCTVLLCMNSSTLRKLIAFSFSIVQGASC